MSQIWEYYPSYVDTLVDALGDFKDRCPKSIMIVISSGQLEAEALEIRNRLIDKGVPSFPDFERAAGALKRVTEYYKSHRDGD